jgi:hypothetical protein
MIEHVFSFQGLPQTLTAIVFPAGVALAFASAPDGICMSGQHRRICDGPNGRR